MNLQMLNNIEQLHKEHKLDKDIIIWGVSNQNAEVIDKCRAYGKEIYLIIDNFRCAFQKEFKDIPVRESKELHNIEKDNVVVLVTGGYAEAICRQVRAYGITEMYNLADLTAQNDAQAVYDIPYHFIDRKKNCKTLCYILSGYEQDLWDVTLGRIEAFQSEEVDYCLVSSGKYDAQLEALAERNQWSYLYTEQNQVCYIQNLVIDNHPCAEYIIKMDEDMFIGKDFFPQMISEFQRIEREGEYRIGFAVPVIPLNCNGYVTYLQKIGKKAEFEERFGRAYKSRFSAVFTSIEVAEYLWDTIDTFDAMADRFAEDKNYGICDCYFNIGCIMFARERWLMMGKWPERIGESGMGTDERFIYEDSVEKDMSVYEIQSVLVGHLAFGHQKRRMKEFFREHPEKFRIMEM